MNYEGLENRMICCSARAEGLFPRDTSVNLLGFVLLHDIIYSAAIQLDHNQPSSGHL